jgi:hypothetical protein
VLRMQLFIGEFAFLRVIRLMYDPLSPFIIASFLLDVNL